MMNQIQTATGFYALSAEQKAAHRGKIAIRVRSILNQFWRDDVPAAVEAMEREAWVETLAPLSHDELLSAWVEYQRTGPRTERGTLIKPDAGALYRIAMGRRPKPRPVLVQRAAEPDRVPVTPDRATEILCEVFGEGRAGDGFVTPQLKRFGKHGVTAEQEAAERARRKEIAETEADT